ncbi:MAG TPA: hypothetical protein DEA96_15505 [Leptospiraceae bacterium]|nr:hypothetical protein [Spirochaetaceae bacterium]HBS06374.1 hypothetical protein [Leptospiraceae bacterium]|tara:strand:+ start:769 stop:1524 length:756 start_codon:yes stop_codon:yes gene_type:complete
MTSLSFDFSRPGYPELSWIFGLLLLGVFLSAFVQINKTTGWNGKMAIWTAILFAALILQGVYGWLGLPERIIRAGYLPLAVLPLLLPFTASGLALFCSAEGRRIIGGMSLTALTWIHSFRIVIEGVLFMGFLNLGGIPEEMTVFGRNPDIYVGLSAPLIAWLYSRRWLPGWGLITWNLLSLGCLFNIVGVAILSMPTQFQMFGLDQPNVAVLRFPFILLPAFLVPVALLSHIYSFAHLFGWIPVHAKEISL